MQNERAKVVPPLAARDTVTRNVSNRFVSPLPPATILDTPNALRGSTSPQKQQHHHQQSQTARPASSQTRNKQQQHARITSSPITSSTSNVPPAMIAAPPHTSRVHPSSSRQLVPVNTNVTSPEKNDNNISSPSFVLPTHQQQQQQQSEYAQQAIGYDKLRLPDEMPADAPPALMLEYARRTVLDLYNTVDSAEINMYSNAAARESESSEFVLKFVREAKPHSDEIRDLLEGMTARAPSLQLQVEFASAAERSSRLQEQEEEEEEENIIADNEDEEETFFSDENEKSNNKSEKRKRPAKTTIQIPESMDEGFVPTRHHLTEAELLQLKQAAASQRRRSSLGSVDSSSASAASPLTLLGAAAAATAQNRRKTSLQQGERSFFDSSFRSDTSEIPSAGVTLDANDDVDAQLHVEGKPMQLEISRGLAAVQRAIGNVVQIFDACGSSSQRQVENQVERIQNAQAQIIPTCKANLDPNEFINIKQFLQTTNTTSEDASTKLQNATKDFFSVARDAAGNIAVGLAEARDSLLKLQHVINDLKIEQQQMFLQNPSSATATTAPSVATSSAAAISTTHSPNETSANPSFAASSSFSTNDSNNNESPSKSDQTPSGSSSAVFVARSSSVHAHRPASSTAVVPRPTLNPYQGTTIICVAVENALQLVNPYLALDLSNKRHVFSTRPSKTHSLSSSELHSVASGKLAMQLIRSFISNTVITSGGHLVALRATCGPFLIAFESLTSAMSWCRGLHLFSTALPWPEDILTNPSFALKASKNTKLDLTDATGLERAMSSGAGAAAVLMESQTAPLPVNQMSITEDIFYNAWRSMLSDGGVVNGPGGELAQKLSRISQIQMRETFNCLHRGRMFERRGPQFKVGIAFESLASNITSNDILKNLQRTGGFRPGVATATSLCAIARGASSVSTKEVALLVSQARNASSLSQPTSMAMQAEEDGLRLLIQPPNVKLSTSSVSSPLSMSINSKQEETTENSGGENVSSSGGGENNTNNTTESNNNTNTNTNNSPSTDETGTVWLPFGLLDERNRFILRSCGCERIFEVPFVPNQTREIIQQKRKDEEEAKKKAAKNKKKTLLSAQQDSSSSSSQEHNKKRRASESITSPLLFSGGIGVGAVEGESFFFDPDSGHFDSMWWSRDDVTGGGIGAIIRPLEMSYLLPPLPIPSETCSIETQCEIIINPNIVTSRPGSPNQTQYFSPDQTTASGVGDMEQVAAALSEAYHGGDQTATSNTLASPDPRNGTLRPGAASPTNASTTLRSPLRSTTRNNNTRTTRNSSTGRSRSRRRKKEKVEPVEEKPQIVFVERGEQTMMSNEEGNEGECAAAGAGSVSSFGGETYKNEGQNILKFAGLFEGLVLFLSGSIDVRTLRDAVTEFVGPMQQLTDEKGNLSCDDDVLVGASRDISNFSADNNTNDDDDDTNNKASKKNININKKQQQPTWDSISDTLVQHLSARLTFPIPPSADTTFRLIVANIIACVAEFVKTLPKYELDEARGKFKKLFDRVINSENYLGGSSIDEEEAQKAKEIKEEEKSKKVVSYLFGRRRNDNNSQADKYKTSTVPDGDPTLRSIASAASIAQLIRDKTFLDAAGVNQEEEGKQRFDEYETATHRRIRHQAFGGGGGTFTKREN